MNIQAVIFDMDGVICHTNPYHSKAFDIFFQRRGIHATEEEYKAHMYGKSNSYIFTHFFGRPLDTEELDAVANEKEALFREIYADHIQCIDGWLEFLDDLKSNGIKTGVATSAPRANLDLIMGTLGFESKMESILAWENVVNHKPHPEVYLNSAKNLGCTPDQCIVFEDSFSGVSAGLNASMKVVGVLSSHTVEELPTCDMYISDYKNLKWPIF
ncbi:MAG: HAD family hydrolase [Leadbetterella sp.]